MGPNGLRTGRRQVSQSHSDEVAAPSFRGSSGAVHELPELFITLGTGCLEALAGNGTVRYRPCADAVDP